MEMRSNEIIGKDRWVLVSLHLFLTDSFATVWYKVLNG